MATSFFLMSEEKKGEATLFVRLQSRKHGINYKVASALSVDIQAWNKSKKSSTTMNNFRNAYPELTEKMDAIRKSLDLTLNNDSPITKDEMRGIIDSIVYAEAKAAQKKKAEEKARKEEEAKRMTLNKFIKMYIEQISTGARQTEQGRNYAYSTVKAIKQAMKQFEMFQKSRRRTYDFKDIDMNFYYDYTAYLKKKEYSINSVGKCIKELKSILYAAETEGYHSNNVWKDKKFKGTRVDIDSIYLTQEDLDKIMAVDMSKLSTGHAQARDIFMVGVWTAQRVSDYNNIKKEDFDTLTKNVMKEADDPENPGKKKAWIEQQEITYLNIRQKKTGAKVAIPCNSALKEILEKYDYQLPHLEDQVINRYIKDVAKEAGLTEFVEIETTKGGTPKKERIEKYKLIHTHTARRTGATLMYLAGIDVYDIMKVTGHSSPAMLKKYIKADSLEVVEKLTDKYDYFR
ncbi:MAG: site-specific integrase [Bacteroidales bacterium]|nr:site-specific integrase [Bacteroidales bacterium]